MFTAIVSFFNDNSGAIIAITTIIYAVITSLMLYETKRIRVSSTEPFVFIHTQPSEDNPQQLEMVIQNIGPGPAYDLSFEITPDIELRQGGPISKLNLIGSGFRYLAPNQKLTIPVASLRKEATKTEKTLLSVKVRYKNRMHATCRGAYKLDFSEYLGMLVSAEPDPLKGINENLKNIHGDLDKLVQKH